MTEQEIKYHLNTKIAVSAYEWYIAMQFIGWVSAGGQAAESKPDATAAECLDEIRNAASRQYHRMREDITGDFVFRRMHETFTKLEEAVKAKDNEDAKPTEKSD